MTIEQSSKNISSLSSQFQYQKDLNNTNQTFIPSLLTNSQLILYGKIDNQFNPIIPKSEYLTQNGLLQITETLFNELKNNIKLLNFRGIFSGQNKKLLDINIHSPHNTPSRS